MNWKFSVLAIGVLIFLGCNNINQTEILKNDIEEKALFVLSQKSKDLKNNKDTFLSYINNSRKVLHEEPYDKSKALLDFMEAKVNYSEKIKENDAMLFLKSLRLLEKNPENNLPFLIDGYYQVSYFYIFENPYYITANSYMAKSVFYANLYTGNDTLVQKKITITYKDYAGLNRVLFNNNEALIYIDKSIALASKLKTKEILLSAMGEKITILSQLERFEDAELLIKEALKLATTNKFSPYLIHNHAAEMYFKIGKYDSSYTHLILEKELKHKKFDIVTFHINNSEVLTNMNRLNEATPSIQFLESKFDSLDEYDKPLVVNCITKFYIATKNFEKAQRFFLLNETIYKNYYTKEKAILSEDLIKKYQLAHKEIVIKNSLKDNLLLKKQLSLQKVLIVFIVLFFMLIFTVGGLVFFRNKSKKLKTELKAFELEDRLLRSQMEPHFIFNSLTSLQSLILDGQNQKTSLYLSKFAKLLRETLENSKFKFISLQSEISNLKNYMDLQKLRFGNLFEYAVNCHIPNPENCMIPPFMVQPFIENAIYHGFKEMGTGGFLQIKFEDMGDFIGCTIEDNGQVSTAIDFKDNFGKKKSLSTQITNERIQAITRKKDDNVIITPASESKRGYTVFVKLPKEF